MNIAIVAPSHVPFALGGAERLWRNLCDAFNDTPGVQADIIKIPAKEGGFWQLVDSYQEFYKLDLNHFDQIITGKNPTWMIQHPNHVVYMLHPLRGVYDTYHLFHLPEEVASASEKINKIARACKDGVGTDELFSLLSDLRNSTGYDEAELALPSPFLRAVVQRFDANAMKGVKRFSAISKTVANRREYFHGKGNATVVYPPSDLPVRMDAPQNYFFTYSRLDEAKRIDLIVSAFRKLDTNFELRIGGVGGALAHLEELAGGDSRIKFLGRLSEERLVEELSTAYAVPFVPYEEDYGLVAIEALRAGKPLITCRDSGGPTEFITNGYNGFIADPSVDSLSDAMRQCIDSQDYQALARAAKLSVEKISWKTVVENLLPSTFSGLASKSRPRLVSLSTYPIYPPKGGGQARVFYLCRELSKAFDVHVVCLVDGAEKYDVHHISDSLTVEYIPADKAYCEKDWDLYQASGIPTTDVSMVAYFEEAASFVLAARNAMENADVVVAEQSYTYALLNKYATNQIRVYNSQNIELVLKQQMFRNSAAKDVVLDLTEKAEKLACDDADLIVYCSESDRKGMASIYSINEKKRSVIVENGAAGETISYLPSSARRALKERVAPNQTIGIFVASWHQPNIEAVRDLDRIASQTKDILYVVVGSVGDYFKQTNEIVSENIIFTGLVTEHEKDILLQLADVAVNPMSTGSGTNIKMFDYMASGLPLVTTEIGARGINLPKEFAHVVPLEEFPSFIKEAAKMPRNIQKKLFVEENYDWRAVSSRYIKELLSCIDASKVG